MRDIVIVALMAVGLLVWDHQAQGILPDQAYCFFGAGVHDRIASRVTSWHVDPSTGRRIPAEWSAPGEICVHTTLWDAYRPSIQSLFLKAKDGA